MGITGLKRFLDPLKEKSFLIKAISILTGVASTVWFLLRVIPKPSRASYPCMRAAAPIMSSFILWTISVIGMAAFYKKAKTNYFKSKFVISGMFAMAFMVCFGMFQVQNAKKLKAADPIALAAAGTPKGIFIGRVAWVYNPDAAKWGGGGNFWASGNSQVEYNAAFTQGLQVISGGSGDAGSWDKIFVWFNDNHGRPGTGYRTGDQVAIKINSNNTANSGGGGGGMNPNPFACIAVVASLVNAGVPQADIWIGDPSRAVTDNIFFPIHAAYPDVNVVDYFGNNGRKKTGVTPGDYPLGKISTCFANARYIIALPILKGHPGQNFSFGAKLFFGTSGISNNWANNGHPGGNDWEEMFLTHKNVGGKVVLWCMDASYPCPNLDTTPSTNKGANFLMSLDGVAEESVSLDMWNSYYGKGLGGENYIHIAASKGAGLHEHWNASKKYSRNVDPNAIGIELVYKTKPWDDLSIAITSPANNISVSRGTTVSIIGNSKPEAGYSISKVVISEGGVAIGEASGTTSWTYGWLANAEGNHKLTATAYSTSGKPVATDLNILVTVPSELTSIVVLPQSGSVEIGGTMRFSAQGYDQFAKPIAASFAWNVSDGGTIDGSGIFKGEKIGGPYLVTASANNSAGVTITGPAKAYVTEKRVLTSIVVTPSTADVQIKNTVAFKAQGYDQFTKPIDAIFDWKVIEGGTISDAGLFTGEIVGGPYKVTASSGSIISNEAEVFVKDGPQGDPIPGVVQAENYTDMFGVKKEPTKDVGGGENVGYIDPKDWMTYRVTVKEAGNYKVNFRVAGWSDTARVSLQDASFKTLASAKVPNGGPATYQKWSTVTGDSKFTLQAGTQIIRIYADGGSWNLNWFSIDVARPSIRVEAESYSDMLGIQTEPTKDADGGVTNIGWTHPGDWLDYKVNIPADGLYTIDFRVASALDTGEIELRNQAGTSLANLKLGTTGDWQNWVTKSVTANLIAGAQTLRIHYVVRGMNINWFEITPNIPFSVYQNPASDMVTVETNNPSYNSLEIRANTGTLLMNAPVSGPLTSVKVNNLAPGAYQVTLKGTTATTSQVIIVE